MIKVGKGPASN